MQIHTDKLPTLIEFAHRGLLRRNNVSTPSMRARDGHEERRPRSFMPSGDREMTPKMRTYKLECRHPRFDDIDGHG